MGWLIAAAILFLIAVLPVGGLVRYDSRGFYGAIVLGALRIRLFPMKKKTKPPKKKQPTGSEKPPQKNQPSQPGQQNKASGGSLVDFLPVIQVAMDFLGDFRRKLRVNHFRLKLILAAEDPCDLAIHYGRAWAAMGNLLPILERGLNIQKRDMEIECDFTAEQTLITAQAEITLRIFQMFSLGAVYGFRILKEFLKIKKKRKGGAVS